MNFDPRWDILHREHQWATNPCEHLCRFVAGNYPGDRTALHALDLGCGAGAQSLYLRQAGFEVRAIDGSPAAIAKTKAMIEQYGFDDYRFGAQIGDFGSLPWIAPCFDLVVDVASLQCLDHTDAVKALAEVYRVLKPGGRLFSYTSRFGTSPEVHRGMPVRSMFYLEVMRLYGVTVPFQIESVDHASHSQKSGKTIVRHWIIVARKPI